MNKLLALFVTVLLASCGGSSDPTGVAGTYSGAAVNTSTSTASTTSSAAAESSTFLITAYQDGIGELALSQLALQRASDDDVRAFAQIMVGDHTQANNEITQLAQARNITLPSALSAEDQTALQSLSNLSGADFDKAYMNQAVTAHEKDGAAFRTQAISGTDAGVKTFASNTLPLLQAHLLAAKGINGEINPAAYLVNAYVDGKAEILLSTLALQKSTNAELRTFAQTVIDQHTQVNNQITQLAQAKNIALPADVTVEHQAAYEDLSRMSGVDFDKAYMNHNVLVHELDVAQTTAQADNGTDAEIKAFASNSLPLLSTHLQMANTLYASITPRPLLAAFQDGSGEVLLSKLALQKASDASVRTFAERMIDDHTRLDDEVVRLAESKNLTLLREISPQQLRDYITGAQLSAPAFDNAYMSRNVDVHTKDVAQFQQYVTTEPDAEIKAFSAATLLILAAHLEAAQQINTQVNAAAQ